MGDTEGAVKCHTKAIQINPDHAMAHYNLGLVFEKINNLNDAIASYRTALELKPDFPQASNNLAHARRLQVPVQTTI